MKNILFASMLLCGLSAWAQNDRMHQKFYDAASAYFKADREKIHLHPNKTVFVNSETIWFKGYITELKTGLPYGETTNVHVQLRDASGKVHYQLLAFAEGSVFTGFIPLGEQIKGGIYQIHAYTNFMNNFAEDESAAATISIIDAEEGNFYNLAKKGVDPVVTFWPEGGEIIDGISNTIGVKIQDCNGNGIAVSDAQVVDSAGKTITTFSTPESGYARFDIPSASVQQYAAKIRHLGKSLTSNLPMPVTEGVALSANSYANPQKTVIRLRTNTRGVKNKYNLYIQQAALATGIEVDLSTGEKTLAIPTAELPYGVNSVFVTDATGKLLSRRLFYNQHPALEPTLDFSVSQKKDSVEIKGISSIKNGEVSISILPVETVGTIRIPDMAASVWVEPFLQNPIGEIAALIADYSRKNGFELDNRLLCNEPKYEWEKINGTPPANKYAFDIGLSVKGTINSVLRDRASSKVVLTSHQLGLNESMPIDERNEVIFGNIMAVDSTQVHFSLYDKKEKLGKMQMAFSLMNGVRPFVKPYHQSVCDSAELIDDFSNPKVGGAIELSDVVVRTEVRKEKKMSNLSRYNNNMARGYKIGDTEAKTYRDVLGFIQNHGYDVQNSAGGVVIRSRVSRSFKSSATPAVMIDDVPVTDFNQLYGLNLEQIDEIYINKHGFGAGEMGGNGVIRIYAKRDFGARAANEKILSQAFLIKNGFQQYREFEMPQYDSFGDVGFRQFGTIHWLPRVGTTADGQMGFAIPNTGLDQVKVVIRGITSNGTPISETKILKLK